LVTGLILFALLFSFARASVVLVVLRQCWLLSAERFHLIWCGWGLMAGVCVRVCSGGGVRAEQAARDRGRAGGAAAGR
jgi:hypothetical protein